MAVFRNPFERQKPETGERPHDVEPYVRREKIRTIHFGIGAIGAAVVRSVLQFPEIEIVGAIDASPSRVARDLGEAADAGRPLGIKVSYDAEALLRDVYADVVVHCTGSSLTEVYPQLMSIISSEKSVVSTCEELSFPWPRYPEISQKLDARAREAGVRVVGAGVNPGFVMDLLPLVMITACQQVKLVRVARVVDVAKRRLPLQRKVGVGLTVKGFHQGAAGGVIGHVGLRESALMIADALGWKLDDMKETIEPVVAKKKVSSEFMMVERGHVAGVRQSVSGTVEGREVLRLDLEMSLGAADPHDSITIDAVPPVKLLIPGGLQGDLATAAVITNCIPAVAHSRAAGLLTMRDLPAVPYMRPWPGGRGV